jgi:sugar/nucleoside kinase (ribokinase family)
MPSPTRLDVLAIGNAVVDIIADADDAFLDREGLTKGMMRLIDAGEATRLYDHMGPAREISGGSAGNTAAGVAALGGRAGFVGQVAPDQLGEFYRHDLTAAGVEFITPAADLGQPTGRVIVLVTPDAHRTMNTFLGAAQLLPPEALDEAQIEGAAILYLEGYLWDPEAPRYAMIKAIDIARRAGRKIAFTLSDTFCIDRHRDGFNGLIDGGKIDILFANEAEIQALAGVPHFETAVAATAKRVPLLVVTRSEKGAIAAAGAERAEVGAEPVARIVDTTGAGDLFAAGFLAGQAQGRGLEDSLRIGAIAAAEVISHYGARPEADLKALVAARLG